MEAIGWDEELPYHLKAEWKKWFKELGELDAVCVPGVKRTRKRFRKLLSTRLVTRPRKPTLRHLMYAMSMKMGQ